MTIEIKNTFKNKDIAQSINEAFLSIILTEEKTVVDRKAKTMILLNKGLYSCSAMQ